MLGIPIAYMIFVILYAIFVPNNAVFYLKYFIAPVFLTSLSIGLIGGVFRLVICHQAIYTLTLWDYLSR